MTYFPHLFFYVTFIVCPQPFVLTLPTLDDFSHSISSPFYLKYLALSLQKQENNLSSKPQLDPRLAALKYFPSALYSLPV